MPAEKKSITIIGGGLGGLTAGALLAQEGYPVTLLEQHNIVGGCATTFKRKGGFTCEVGLHEMDGVYTNPMVQAVFDKLNVHEHVAFVKPDEFFAVTTTGRTFVMPDDTAEAQQKLAESFPGQKKGIRRYFETIARVAGEMEALQEASWYQYALFPFVFPNILRYKNKSARQVLDGLLDDEELKLILNANIQYYNDTPDTLSFLLHAVAQHSYYSGGGWFIRGGSWQLSKYLARVIEEHGGAVKTGADVIACDPTRVTYVHKKETHTLPSDIIISNLSPEQTYDLFGQAYRESKELSDSLLTVYFGFGKNLRETYGKGAYSHFIFDELASVDDYNRMLKKEISQRGFVFVDYSQIDSALTKKDSQSFGVACMSDFIVEWDGLDERAYQEKKRASSKQPSPNLSAIIQTSRRWSSTPKSVPPKPYSAISKPREEPHTGSSRPPGSSSGSPKCNRRKSIHSISSDSGS